MDYLNIELFIPLLAEKTERQIMALMTLKDLATLVAETEGRKSQATIGDIREVISIISDLIFTDPEIIESLRKNGERRFLKTLKKKEKKS
jgi:hypothetical protein